MILACRFLLPPEPRTPRSPAPRRVQPLVSELLLQAEPLVLLVLRLGARVDAVADVGVGVHVVRLGAAPLNDHLSRWQRPEIGGRLGRVRPPPVKAPRGPHLLRRPRFSRSGRRAT